MSAEQQARDMLARMGVEGAQEFSAGDLTEIANLIAGSMPAPMSDRELCALIEREGGQALGMADMLWAVRVARAVERAYGITDGGDDGP